MKRAWIIAVLFVCAAVCCLRLSVRAQSSSQLSGAASFTGSGSSMMGSLGGGASLLGSTPTQHVLTYTAPDAGTHCTIEVSESAGYSPLVPDINSSLFADSNDDLDRYPGLQNGTARIFIVGSVPRQGVVFANQALDSNYYSRALQENTTYYYRITCGASVSTGKFQTRVAPFGRTYPYDEPIAAAGQYGWPTLLADRTQTFPDPDTGVLIRRIDLPGDQTGVKPGGYSIGNQFACGTHPVTDDLAASWYLCAVPMAGGNPGNLYSINTSTGQAVFLGWMEYPATTGLKTGGGDNWILIPNSANFDASDSTIYYTKGVSTTNNNFLLISCQLPASGSSYYRTGLSQNSAVNFSRGCTILTPEPNNLLAKLTAFDGTFNGTSFSGLGIDAVQSHYIVGYARGGAQDSVGWRWAFDISTTSVVGMFPVWQKPSCRWCGLHNIEALDASSEGWLTFINHQLNGNALYQGLYQTTLQTNMNATDVTDVISVSTINPVSSFDSSTLQTIAVGDVISSADTGEVMLVTNVSGTDLTVTRGYGGSTKATHSIGELFYMFCNSLGFAVGKYTNSCAVFWDFVNDPHATDTGGTYIQIDSTSNLCGGHEGQSGDYRIGEDYYVCNDPINQQAACPSGVIQVSSQISFAGTAAQNGAADYQKHPTPAHQLDAPSNQQVWGMDTQPFFASGISGGGLQTSWTNVTGTLYKITQGIHNGATIKIFPLTAMCGYKPLVDVGGPSSSIGGTAGSNYKYCVAYKANECVAGSSAGDIYVNCPSITTSPPECKDITVLSYPSDESDICIGNKMSYGNESIQIDMRTASTNGSAIRPLTSDLTPYRMQSGAATAEQIPNGQWAMVYRLGPDTTNELLIKMPSFSQDAVARNDFRRETIALTAPGGMGVATALIEFGYDANFYCTSRQEVCVAVGSWVAESANPFWFETADTGSYTRTSCATSCSIDVPVISGRVAWYRAKYYDGGGSLVSTGATQAMAAE